MSNKIPILQQKPPAGQQIRINIDELECVKCEDCGGENFDHIWRIHKVPAILSQTGKEALLPVAYFKCTNCLKLTKIVHRN